MKIYHVLASVAVVLIAGSSAFAGELPKIADKTFVAWVYLDNLDQRGGAVIELERTDDTWNPTYDGLMFGETTPGRWTAGSRDHVRTLSDKAQKDLPAETADPRTMIQLAVVYRGKQVTIYRNGKVYSQYEISAPVEFGPDSHVRIGMRGVSVPCRELRQEGIDYFFKGAIEDVRIYDRALSAEQITVLAPHKLSDPKPACWWNFEGGKTQPGAGAWPDAMGAMPPLTLLGNAYVDGGKLQLHERQGHAVSPPKANVARIVPYDTPTNFRPDSGVFADPIPFFWKGVYHMFFLNFGRDGIGWYHAISTDLVHWKEIEPALLAEVLAEPASVKGTRCQEGTGSVIEKDGVFHIFYCRQYDKNVFKECIRHATSKDLVHWTKDPDFVLRPDGVYYKNDPKCDWRDSYVFWNDEEQQYWMVMHCNPVKGWNAGLLTSKDMFHWKHEPPIQGANTQECPDMFKIGDTWYLIGGAGYCTFAKTSRGPFAKSPVSDRIDSMVYAGKRMFDGKRHVWTGWVWKLETDTDGAPVSWFGMQQCMPRELYAGPGGQLYCKPVHEVVDYFDQAVTSLKDKPKYDVVAGKWEWQGPVLVGKFVWDQKNDLAECSLAVPANYYLEATVRLDDKATLALTFRQQPDGAGYKLALDPAAKEQLTLSGPKFAIRRPCPVDLSMPIKLQVFVQGTVIECFVNEQYAQTCHSYNYSDGRLGIGAIGGEVHVESLEIRKPSGKK